MVGGLARGGAAVVAGRAARAHGNIGVKFGWSPTGITCLVTGIAVAAGERLVGNVAGRESVCRRVGTTVAGRTLVGDHRLGVIPAGGLPS